MGCKGGLGLSVGIYWSIGKLILTLQNNKNKRIANSSSLTNSAKSLKLNKLYSGMQMGLIVLVDAVYLGAQRLGPLLQEMQSH